MIEALGAGIAGGLALVTDIPESLVGVMIAVALIPSIAVIGIGISTLNTGMMGGATALLLLNLAGISVGGATAFRVLAG